ncbi:Predicted arabinose efflux permease, MFS family [Streptomyces sp. 1222.5]|uniref:MFS transporter n=1 Tax=unclassified Streptomyces TaxID=2593676 RepID=UPI0008985B3F|nr:MULTISPECIES: MFS transporter [unclassified Streptomyces]PKW00395.1 putative MFS family arabinose efflux permease [Streptomyces sp. 5112.2]SED86960.1 Predicted arabinose efflux permease, MFS family [Streptomyces sp. 1222.5]
MAIAGAVTVANIYFPQPLLEAIAHGLGVSENSAGLIASAAQIGYAIGILLIVPLTDTARLRRLVFVLLAVTCAGLLVAAMAPNLATLTVATLAVSTATVLPQIITPTAAALAGPDRSGHVVGLVGLGLTLGSTLSRTVSGAVSDATGNWRAAYLLAAVLTGALLLFLPRCMPERLHREGATPLPYAKLLGSLPGLLAAHREVRLSAFLGATVFAAFSTFWAVLSFHLAEPPFRQGPAFAGLFSLYTLPAALLSAYAGRLNDRHGPTTVNICALGCIGVSFALFGLLGDSMAALVVGSNLLTLGTSASQVANQARLFVLGGDTAARLNTIFMLSSFAGGAVGSLSAAAIYDTHGWTGMVLVGTAFLVLTAGALGQGLLGRTRAGSRSA